MPAIPPAFAALVATAPLPLDDFDAQPLQDLPRTALLVIARQAAELLGAGTGALLVELGVARDQLRAPLTAADLAASAAFTAVSRGTRTVARGERDQLLGHLIQRALQAVAARVAGAPRSLTLPRWGADGAFGEESVIAVRDLQAWSGLAVTGTVSAAEARVLHGHLAATTPPDLFDAGHEVVALGQGARRIATIAQAIVRATEAAPFAARVDGVRYTCHAVQFGTAPTPGLLRLPGGVAYNLGSTTYWKCNIFGGAVLSLADLPVPTFEAGRYRHFPRAERFGPALAQKTGWRLVRHLDHRDPANPERATVSEANDRAIAALLDEVRPGDLLFVDHPGPPGDDGGHTRICTRAAQDDDRDHAPLFAQARVDAAREERDGLRDLGRGAETQFWLLRSTL